MSGSEKDSPHFISMVRASGLAEIWTHDHDMEKFGQFGWRCTTKEDAYGNPTLIGNWNERRFDISRMREAKPLPSEHGHYFETTYDTYNTQPYRVPKELQHLKERHYHSFPGHQPELDSPGIEGRLQQLGDYIKGRLRSS
ncbi:hypothetical protein ScPMuIL_002909 [Solemya velum]